MKSAVWIQALFASSAVAAVPFVPKVDWADGPPLPAGEQSVLVHPNSRVHSDCEPLNANATPDTLVGQLWRNNCDIVHKFLTNKFSVAAAQDYSYDDAFKYYSIQDYYYLLETVLHKAYVVESDLPAPEKTYAMSINKTVNSMQKGIVYASEFRQTLVNDLKIKDSDIENGRFNAAGVGYVRWLQANTNLGQFAFQVSRIACIYGWSELANALDSSNNINRTTLFYKEWVEPNLDWSYGNSMIERLQTPVDLYNSSVTFEAYNILFRQGMAFEIAFFESAIGKHPNDVLV